METSKTESKRKNKMIENGKGILLKKRKSKIALFWEKYPEGILEIVDMKAVLR